MYSNNLSRLSACMLIVGGILGMAAHVVHPDEPTTPEQIHTYLQRSPTAHVVLFFAVILVLLGMPALYARFTRSESAVALVGLPLMFIGLTLGDLMHCPLEFGAMPSIYKSAPDKIAEIYHGFNNTPYGVLGMVGGPLFMLGVLLFVIAAWRVQHTPNWPRWIMLGSFVSMIVMLFGLSYGGVLFTVLFYAAITAYGALMLRPRTSPAQ